MGAVILTWWLLDLGILNKVRAQRHAVFTPDSHQSVLIGFVHDSSSMTSRRHRSECKGAMRSKRIHLHLLSISALYAWLTIPQSMGNLLSCVRHGDNSASHPGSARFHLHATSPGAAQLEYERSGISQLTNTLIVTGLVIDSDPVRYQNPGRPCSVPPFGHKLNTLADSSERRSET